VIAAAALPYVPSLWGGFALDDYGLIVTDPLAQSLVHLPETFTKDFLRGTLGPNVIYYRPLVTASFQANYMIAGPNPFVFRLFNLLVHVAAALLVFALARRLTRSLVAAGIAGVAFGVLPSHAEAAAWISGRTDLMSCVFTLGAVLVFAASCEEERGFSWASAAPANYPHPLQVGIPGGMTSWMGTRAGACALLTICALFSKENALVLPVLAAGCAWVFGCRASRADKLKWAAAFVVPLVVFMLIRRHAVHVTIVNYPTVALGRRLLGVGIAYAAYLRMLLVPMVGRVVYDVFPIGMKYPAIALAAWLLPVGLVVLTVRLRRSSPVVAFGTMWVFLTLLPVSNILPTSGPLPAERFVYLASVGSAIVLGWLASRMLAWRPASISVWPAVSVVIVVWYALLCGTLAYLTSQQYESDVAWARAVSAINGRFFRSWAGFYFSEAGLFKDAAREYEAAIREATITHVPPERADYVGLANARRALGQPEKAVEVLEAARATLAPSARIELNLGTACAQAGRMYDAEEAFTRAVRLDSKLAAAWRGLGRARLRLGGYRDAVTAYEHVFALGRASDRDRRELELALRAAGGTKKGGRER